MTFDNKLALTKHHSLTLGKLTKKNQFFNDIIERYNEKIFRNGDGPLKSSDF